MPGPTDEQTSWAKSMLGDAWNSITSAVSDPVGTAVSHPEQTATIAATGIGIAAGTTEAGAGAALAVGTAALGMTGDVGAMAAVAIGAVGESASPRRASRSI